MSTEHISEHISEQISEHGESNGPVTAPFVVRQNISMQQNALAVGRFDGLAGRSIALVAVAAGVVAAIWGVSPTGSSGPDALLVALAVGAMTWAGAYAPWWALVGAGAVAAACSDLRLWSVLALAGAAIGFYLGAQRRSAPALSALSIGLTVQTLAHLEVNPYLGASMLIALLIAAVVMISAGGRMPTRHGRILLWCVAGVVSFAVVATVLFGFSAYRSKDDLRTGYNSLIEGLRQLRAGQPEVARETFRSAAASLDEANSGPARILTQPARLVPVVAQHRRALSSIVDDASLSATAAADALAVLDVERLRVIGGTIDVEAIAQLATPMKQLSLAVQQMSSTIDEIKSPWLISAVQDRLAVAETKLDAAELQAVASEAAAAHAPAMLGRDGPRTYLVAFTSPGEARGQSGLIGNYVEIEINGGRLQQTGFGRTSQLVNGIRASPPFALQLDPAFLAQYGPFGAVGADGSVVDKFWSNVTMSPNMPIVGEAMAQMYAGAGLGDLDGVFVIDTFGLAAMLKLTGPVIVPGVEAPFSAESLQNFLLYDQYQIEEDLRRAVLEGVADATIRTLLAADLPVPEKLAHELGPAATEGHISGWARRTEEQELLVRVGMSARLPEPDGRDGLVLVTNNASGNKIDSFLERSATYNAVVDNSGLVEADLEIVLHNTAPPDGYPDYVIGNLVGLPKGTNRTLLGVYSPLDVVSAELNGIPVQLVGSVEQGWNTATMTVDIPAGEVRSLSLKLRGKVDPDGYAFVWKPQPLTRNDTLVVDVRSTDGSVLASHSGEIKRLSTIDRRGVTAIR